MIIYKSLLVSYNAVDKYFICKYTYRTLCTYKDVLPCDDDDAALNGLSFWMLPDKSNIYVV